MINRIAHRLVMMKLAGYTSNGTYEAENELKESMLPNMYKKTLNYISRNYTIKSVLRDLLEAEITKLNSQHGKSGAEEWMPPFAPGFELARSVINNTDIPNKIIDTLKAKYPNIPVTVFDREFHNQYDNMRTHCMDKNGKIWSETDIRKKLRELNKTLDEPGMEGFEYDREQEDEDVAKYNKQITVWNTFNANVWNYILDDFKENAITWFYNSGRVSKKDYGIYSKDSNAPVMTSKVDGSRLTPDQVYKADWSIFEQGKQSHDNAVKRSFSFAQAIPEYVWTYYHNKFKFDPNTVYTQREINSISNCTNITAQRNGPFNCLINEWLLKNKIDLTNLTDAVIDYIAERDDNNRTKENKLLAEMERVGNNVKLLLSDPKSLFHNTVKTALTYKLEEMRNEARDFMKKFYDQQRELQKELKKINPDTGKYFDPNEAREIFNNETVQQELANNALDNFYSRLKQRNINRYQTETFNQSELGDF